MMEGEPAPPEEQGGIGSHTIGRVRAHLGPELEYDERTCHQFHYDHDGQHNTTLSQPVPYTEWLSCIETGDYNTTPTGGRGQPYCPDLRGVICHLVTTQLTSFSSMYMMRMPSVESRRKLSKYLQEHITQSAGGGGGGGGGGEVRGSHNAWVSMLRWE